MTSRLLYAHGTVIVLIAFLYFYFGLGEQFFWRIWWWDSLIHLLGGAWAGLASAWLFSLFGRRLSFWRIALSALIVGIGWEIFEYILDISESLFFSREVDLMKDVVVDTVGGICAALFAGWLGKR